MPKREWISLEHKIFRAENGKVYARPTIPGLGRKEFPLEGKLDTLARMIAAKDKKVAELLRKDAPKPASLWRFEDLAKEVIESKRTKAPATLESADIHLTLHLVPWVNENAPYLYEWEERGETLWQQYIEDKRRGTPGIKFLNHRKHLRMVLLRAFERGIIKRKVSLYDPDPEIDVGRVLGPDEVKKLYAASSLTLKVQILMAYSMGFRKSEILRLEWDRVDFESNEIRLLKKHTKTRKPRVVPMNPWVRRALEVRKASQKRDPSPFVFPSRYDRNTFQRSNKTAWREAKGRAGLTARFHDLRHTFITNAVRGGMNPILISKYAGVSQDVMASVYCHLDSSDLTRLAVGLGGKLGESLEK